MSKPWFECWFNEDYEQIYSHRDNREAKQIISLFEKTVQPLTHSTVLDLCCGLGRVSHLLGEHALKVHAIDLSEYFISRCNEENDLDNVTYEVLDIRNIYWVNEFDVIFHIFTSFGYFETLEENLAVFDRIYKAMKHGAYYFFDFLNEVELRSNLDKRSVIRRDDCSVQVTRLIENNRVIKDIIISKQSEQNSYQESVQLISKDSFDSYFKQLGFKTIAVFGDYKGNPFKLEKSKRLIYLLQKD
ncbi:MAG: class I SAM-dependent methyltransferase [Calditrichaeota bacterium]|nr:class I SAM-dependent methyltransferase [Calditrichota bacterium]